MPFKRIKNSFETLFRVRVQSASCRSNGAVGRKQPRKSLCPWAQWYAIQHDQRGKQKVKTPTLLLVAATALFAIPAYAMPHNRPCDIAQDHPGNLNPGGGNAIMFAQCGGITDSAEADVSRAEWWSALSCGYQAYRQNKVIGSNPYYNDQLKEAWDMGWKIAYKACQSGKRPSFDQ